ncbi:MAG: energy-coupling factor transporter transmembrane protein EcfT [bacterium]|nr:energy-coupling factor transporter transmembrane protein EcfT [bacterium]
MIQPMPIMFGQYCPLDSYLHRIDARAKLVPVLLVMVLGLLAKSLVFYLAMMGLLLGALLWSGVGAAALFRNLRPILILVAITFVYHILFSGRQSAPLFDLFGFAITTGGVTKAAFFSLRLLLFVSMVFLVTLTNSPSELAEAVTSLFRPLARIGLPIQELGLILFIAIRFIPILYEEFVTVRNAQTIRGVDFTGSLMNRIRKTTSVLVPVLVSTIGRADELALAMEARGYKSGRPRTFYSRTRFDRHAWLFLTGSLVLTSVCFYYLGR